MKSINKNKLTSSIALVLMLLLSSCLEDTGYLDIFEGKNADAVISFGQADHGYTVRSVEVKTELQPVSVNVNVARASTNVTISFAIDVDALDAYNDAQEKLAEEAGNSFTPFDLLPDSTYVLPNPMRITVPKGTLDGQFSFNVDALKISLAYSYILPIKITTADEAGFIIASNLSTSLIAVGVKNDFDGVYSYDGSTYRYGTGEGYDPVLGYDVTLSGNFTSCDEREIKTITKFSNGFDPLWKNCSTIGGIGTPTVTVDPATTETWDGKEKWKVTVTSTANGTLRNAPGMENTYDPDTKQFILNFLWGAGGAPAPTPGVRTVYAKLTYTGPR